MNLLPGVPEGSVEAEPAGLFAIFGNRASPVTMATVIPPKADRRVTEGVSVGLMHPTGGKAVARLREAGVDLPDGWVVRQDHVRRGLVLRTPPSGPGERDRHLQRAGGRRALPGRDDGPLAGRRLPRL